ncbi:MAG: T9SS type A sorting domain-containing protein, partial [Calditrichaceae bacterium]
PNYYVGDTYVDEITFLKGWIYNRLNWMDEMLLDTVPPDTVRNLHTIAVSNTSFTIEWDDGYDNAAISGYDVFLDGNKVNYAAGSECTVDGLGQSKNYQVEVKARDYAGNYSIGNPVISVYVTGLPGSKNNTPANFKLYQNYPNPFNPATNISWQLAVRSYVDLSIYNILGQKVATLVNKKQNSGKYQVEWNGGNLVSGVYIIRLKAGNFQQTRKMVLLR